MPKGVTTPTKKKLEVIKSYVQTDSYNATEKETGVNHKTVKKIIEENTELYQQKKDEFIEKSSKIIDKALNKLDKELDKENIPVNNLTTVIGTLYDKRALAKGESTENSSFDVNIRVIE